MVSGKRRAQLFRMEEACRQTQCQLDMIDRQIMRHMTALIPQLQPRRTAYRRGKSPDPGAFLERYRSNLAAITAARQPEIDALSRKLARQEQAIAAFRERQCLEWPGPRDPRRISHLCNEGHDAWCGWQGLQMDEVTESAFQRLLEVTRSDTRQARRVANFILACWNAESLGSFDIADLFSVDTQIAADMATVFSWLARQNNAVYPTEDRASIEAVIAQWRPDVWARAQEPASSRSESALASELGT